MHKWRNMKAMIFPRLRYFLSAAEKGVLFLVDVTIAEVWVKIMLSSSWWGRGCIKGLSIMHCVKFNSKEQEALKNMGKMEFETEITCQFWDFRGEFDLMGRSFTVISSRLSKWIWNCFKIVKIHNCMEKVQGAQWYQTHHARLVQRVATWIESSLMLFPFNTLGSSLLYCLVASVPYSDAGRYGGGAWDVSSSSGSVSVYHVNVVKLAGRSGLAPSGDRKSRVVIF